MRNTKILWGLIILIVALFLVWVALRNRGNSMVPTIQYPDQPFSVGESTVPPYQLQPDDAPVEVQTWPDTNAKG